MSCAERTPEGDRLEGSDGPGLVLTVPDGALTDPGVNLTLEELALVPRGAVRAWELGPDGTQFAEPVILEAQYGDFDLPPGVDGDSLRLSVYVDERWVPLADSENDLDKKVVRATTTHFSIYGLVPDPKEVDGRGVLWQANGVEVKTNAVHFVRLSVSPLSINIFLSAESRSPTQVDLALFGLPLQGEHYLYVDGLEDPRLVTPADAGSVILTLDRAQSHYLWLQPTPGTVHIGGMFDQCASVGAWTGNVCRLTSDVVGGVSIDQTGIELDCDAHRVSQSYADRGTGTGILIAETRYFGFPSDVTIRNCVIGGTDQHFYQGLRVFNGVEVQVSRSRFEENTHQVGFISGSGARIGDNTFTCGGCVSIEIFEDASSGTIFNNSIRSTPADEPLGIELIGMIGESGVMPVNGMFIHDNSIEASLGSWFKRTSNNDFVRNEVHATYGLQLSEPGGVPDRFWWNNFQATTLGVNSDSPAEISDGVGRGNWWGHDCSGPLFEAGNDSNAANVVDRYAYPVSEAWNRGYEPGCAALPTPEPPTILEPQEGATVRTSKPLISGTAQPQEVVSAYLKGRFLGKAQASSEGVFSIIVRDSLEDGLHEIVAVAEDEYGNRSAESAPIRFRVDAIDDESPVVSERGHMKLLRLTSEPSSKVNPLKEPVLTTAVVELDPVKSLKGQASNFEFAFLIEQEFVSADTFVVVGNTSAVRAIDPRTVPSDRPWVLAVDSAGWEGRNAVGDMVPPGAYRHGLSLSVIRHFNGAGNGPPCSQGEFEVTAGPGAPACIIDLLKIEPKFGLPLILSHSESGSGGGDPTPGDGPFTPAPCEICADEVAWQPGEIVPLRRTTFNYHVGQQSEGRNDSAVQNGERDDPLGNTTVLYYYANNTRNTQYVVANENVRILLLSGEKTPSLNTGDFLSFGESGQAWNHHSIDKEFPGTVWFDVTGSLQSTPGTLTFVSDDGLHDSEEEIQNRGIDVDSADVCCRLNPSAISRASASLRENQRYTGFLLQGQDVVHLSYESTQDSVVALWGDETADFDLYARCNGRPTNDGYTVRSFGSDSYEALHLSQADCHRGTWNIAVVSYDGRGWFNLVRTVHYPSEERHLRAGTSFTATVTELSDMSQTLQLGARYFYGATEGTQIFSKIELYNRGDCADCAGQVCDVCFMDRCVSATMCPLGECQETAGYARYCRTAMGWALYSSCRDDSMCAFNPPDVPAKNLTCNRAVGKCGSPNWRGGYQALAHEWGHQFLGQLEVFNWWHTLLDEYGIDMKAYCGHSMMANATIANLCYPGDHLLDNQLEGADPISAWEVITGTGLMASYAGVESKSPWVPTQTPDYYDYVDHDFQWLVGDVEIHY